MNRILQLTCVVAFVLSCASTSLADETQPRQLSLEALDKEWRAAKKRVG